MCAPVFPGGLIAFRNCLRRDPQVASDYAQLRRELAQRYEFDREAYTDAKGPFVRRVLELASKRLPNPTLDRAGG